MSRAFLVWQSELTLAPRCPEGIDFTQDSCPLRPAGPRLFTLNLRVNRAHDAHQKQRIRSIDSLVGRDEIAIADFQIQSGIPNHK